MRSMGLSPRIVDLVSTGKTLKDMGYKVAKAAS